MERGGGRGRERGGRGRERGERERERGEKERERERGRERETENFLHDIKWFWLTPHFMREREEERD